MKNIVIFDLDGTLADGSHRVHLVAEKKWDEYFDLCHLDTPKWDIIGLLQDLTTWHDIYILSGRPDSHRTQSEKWLSDHDIYCDKLLMRKAGDHRPDYIVKKEIFLQHFKVEDVLCVFDDRDQVVKMWRKLGLTCCQVAEGDF